MYIMHLTLSTSDYNRSCTLSDIVLLSEQDDGCQRDDEDGQARA